MADILSQADARAIVRRYINKDSTLTYEQVTGLGTFLGFDMPKRELMWENVQYGYSAVPAGYGANYVNDLVYNAAVNAGIYSVEQNTAIQAPLSKVYTYFDYSNDVVQTQNATTEGIFPGAVGTLSTFYTSSYQSTGSAEYYLTINDGDDSTANELFDIAQLITGSILSASANIMYKEFANVLLSGSSQKFVINSNDNSSSFALVFKRNLFKEQVDPGNWELEHNGKHYIDDSGESSGTVTQTGKVYNVVSGSIDDGVLDSTAVGLFYPNVGTIILNTADLSGSNTSNETFFDGIQSVTGRSKQILKNSNYFCRIRNKEYNYTNNPTFLSSSGTGDFIYSTFKNNPKVFPTTVGLYNDNNELLATAKLSKPFKKAFDTEMSIKIKLSF